jgi:hypothetical protein
MAKDDAQRSREYRDRKRGAAPRTVQPCGTIAAARRHYRAGEIPCPPCRAALAQRTREIRNECDEMGKP